jgi:hypothetical protein
MTDFDIGGVQRPGTLTGKQQATWSIITQNCAHWHDTVTEVLKHDVLFSSEYSGSCPISSHNRGDVKSSDISIKVSDSNSHIHQTHTCWKTSVL